MAKTTTIDFFKELFAHTDEPVYICSFTNERGEGAERHVMTRLPAQIGGFIQKWDKPGRGTFFCVSVIDPSASKRNKETVRKTTCLHNDIDFKMVDVRDETAREECLRQLARLKYPPSIIVFSGGGLHCYWLFKEPVETQPNIERVEAALRQLSDVIAGDPAVCEVSRVLRVPGSHNTKDGAWTEVEVLVFEPNRRYELDDLEEWFAEQSPVLLRKGREHAMPAGAIGEMDPFAEYGKQATKAPIDVTKRLEQMMFMGGVESSVHQTQLVCTAALLNSGMPKDDVVHVVLEYTKRAAGAYGGRWNWRREERKLISMCDTWIKKHPPSERKQREYVETVERTEKLMSIEGGKLATQSDKPAQVEADDPSPAKKTADGADNVVKMPVIIKNEDPHIQLGRAVLTKMRAGGEQLINTKDGSWLYADGVWTHRIDLKWLNVKIESSAVEFNFKSSSKLINEARNWIERRPELWRDDDIPWDQHGKIPTRSGLVDPLTGTLEPATAEHFCTWRVEVDYSPEAQCPWWIIMINDMFGDRKPAEQAALVAVIQECIGAALIDKKSRSLSKALIFWGPQNLGKSGPLDVVEGLFGKHKSINAQIGSVETPHGLMPFTKRAPWVLHEAFNNKDWHLPSVIKSIITQEPVQINIKNGPMFTHVVRAPIFWATNAQPQFKEATRAIVSRMIVIEVSRQFDDDNPVGAAREAIKRGFEKPGEMVVATELPGVLNWAIAGLKRAKERGFIELTSGIKETANTIHRDSNLAAGFLDDCVEYDPNARIRIADFCLAHSAWWSELKGEDRRLPSNEAISKALKAMGDARIGMDREEMRDKNSRFYCGIALNKRGLRFHRSAYESRIFEGKSMTATDPKGEVNSLMPVAWDTRDSVQRMRAAHEMTVTGSKKDGPVTGELVTGTVTSDQFDEGTD